MRKFLSCPIFICKVNMKNDSFQLDYTLLPYPILLFLSLDNVSFFFP